MSCVKKKVSVGFAAGTVNTCFCFNLNKTVLLFCSAIIMYWKFVFICVRSTVCSRQEQRLKQTGKGISN